MDEKERSPDQEIEALKKLKRKVFLTVWAYWGQPFYQECWESAFAFVSYAGFLDECMKFIDLLNAQLNKGDLNSDGFEEFLKGYFGV